MGRSATAASPTAESSRSASDAGTPARAAAQRRCRRPVWPGFAASVASNMPIRREGLGHACGHNLIAIAGVATACAVRAALVQHDIPGSVVLLGTPGEEGGGGKVLLLERGAYAGMDACLMCHPAPGPPWSASLSACLAIQRVVVEFHGHT